MTTHEILNTLLFPYVAFVLGSTSRSAAAATLENGATQTLNSASISITKKSKPITSVKLMNGSTVLGEKTGDEVAAGGTITFSDLGITVSKSNNPNLSLLLLMDRLPPIRMLVLLLSYILITWVNALLTPLLTKFLLKV